jgi:hypothetical protein
MRKSRFSDQQIALALQQVEHGASVAEVCRKRGLYFAGEYVAGAHYRCRLCQRPFHREADQATLDLVDSLGHSEV